LFVSGRIILKKYVLFYESADDIRSKAPPNLPAHREHWHAFQTAGTLLMIGTFGNPQEEGAMSVFTTREAAEEFARGDPFVLNGVVRNWYIREWNEVILPSLTPRELRERYPIVGPVDISADRATWQAEAAADVIGE
jgi:uncharacterized protein YciI